MRDILPLAHRDAQSGAKVHVSPGLDQPPARSKPPVDQRPGLVLGMEGGFIHAFTLRSVVTRGKGEISEIALHPTLGDHCIGFRNWTRLHV